MKEQVVTKCSKCGFTYMKNYKPDERTHAKFCNAFELAQLKYGKENVLNYYDREKLKHVAYNNYLDKNNEPGILYKGYVKIMTTYFARSLEYCGYDLNHPSFKDFVGMRMNDGYLDEIENKEVVKMFEANYTRRAGLNGEKYWRKSLSNKKKK